MEVLQELSTTRVVAAKEASDQRFASVLLAAGIGVVHHVFTVSAFRRHGMAAAMTLAAVEAAR